MADSGFEFLTEHFQEGPSSVRRPLAYRGFLDSWGRGFGGMIGLAGAGMLRQRSQNSYSFSTIGAAFWKPKPLTARNVGDGVH